MTPTCLWTEDLDDFGWNAACGHSYCFEYDFRESQQGYVFCPGCGKKIEIAPLPLEPETEE